MEKNQFFDNPLMRTKITSANVKPKEMILGYFLGPFCRIYFKCNLRGVFKPLLFGCAWMDGYGKIWDFFSGSSDGFCHFCDSWKSSGRASD